MLENDQGLLAHSSQASGGGASATFFRNKNSKLRQKFRNCQR